MWRVTRPGDVALKPGGVAVVGVAVVSSSSVAWPGLWRWWRPGVGAGLAGRCRAGGGAAPGCRARVRGAADRLRCGPPLADVGGG